MNKRVFGSKLQKNLALPKIIGSNRIHLHETDSTNAFASDLLTKTSPSHGTVVSADFQHYGKGQYGRSWHASMSKNVICSIVLNHEALSIDHQFSLNAAISLAIKSAISEILGEANDVKIKWPNDIYVSDKKIGGILVQNVLLGKMIKNTVVGIGLNVNEERFPDWIPQPISIFQLLGETFELESIYVGLFAWIEYYLKYMKEQKWQELHQLYNLNLYMSGQLAKFKVNEEEILIEGRIKSVDPLGRLVVKTDVERAYHHHEVKMIV